MNWLKSKDQNISVWCSHVCLVHRKGKTGVYSLNTSLKANSHCTGRCLLPTSGVCFCQLNMFNLHLSGRGMSEKWCFCIG